MNEKNQKRSEAGFTLVEILMATFVLAVAACGMSAAMIHGMTLGNVNAETQAAQEAARQVLEQVATMPLKEAYATYNTIVTDDPKGERTAIGSTFALTTAEGINATAQVVFPGTSGQIREDVTDASLGLPMDLNGDGTIDSEDHSLDFLMLPVRVEVTWNGFAGERTVEMVTVLSKD